MAGKHRRRFVRTNTMVRLLHSKDELERVSDLVAAAAREVAGTY